MTASAVKFPNGWAVVVSRRGAPGRIISDQLTRASAIEVADAYNDPMEAKRKDRYRRNPAKKNPSGTTWALLAVGAAALGVGAYFLLKPSTTPGPSPTPGGGTSRPFGDPADPNSTAFACNAAFKLNAIGHPNEAAPWAGRCSQGGATVPQNASQQYI